MPQHQLGEPPQTPDVGNAARKYQPQSGVTWVRVDEPAYPHFPGDEGDHAAAGSAPVAAGASARSHAAAWVGAIVAAAALIAAVVYLGLNASQVPTATVEEQRALEKVQTPIDAAPAAGDVGANGAPQPNIEPGETPANVIDVPAFALWAPGTKIQTTDHYPQPGESFTAQSCTVAFSFSDTAGNNYAVTAGHCGKEGDLVWPTNAAFAADYAQEAGHFIYSGLYSPGAEGIDVGIIQITDPDRLMEVVGDPIPTGLGVAVPKVERVCKTGGTTGYTCGNFVDTQQVQIVNTDLDEKHPTFGDIAAVCANPGDSGGPVFMDINGRAVIIGVVSGTEAGRSGEACWDGMENPKLMSYSNVQQLLKVVDTAVSDPAWVEQTW